jgi:hypothetical protein
MGELNFLDPDLLADPYPAYRRFRAEDPVHRHPLGFYVLTRYDDVAAFLRDARFGKSGYQALFESRFGGGPDGPATPRISPTPTGWTSSEMRPGIWPSGRGSTTVSAVRSLGSRLKWRSGRSCDDFRHSPSPGRA